MNLKVVSRRIEKFEKLRDKWDYEKERQMTKKIRLPAPKVSGKSFAILAHRGANIQAPENTLPAFAIALGLGFDFELDVYVTRDGHLVVIHDGTVDRTTDGSGSITEKTLAEVKALDAGSWFHPVFRGVHIPTLDEVLRLTRKLGGPNRTIAINIKALSCSIEQKIVRLVEKYGMVSQVFTFDMPLESAKRFKKANPNFHVAASVRDKGSAIVTAGTTSPEGLPLETVLSLPYIDCLWAWEVERRWITPEEVAKVHNYRKKIYATTMCIGRPTEWERLIEAGVDGMCVDDALKLRELLHSKYRAYDLEGKWTQNGRSQFK